MAGAVQASGEVEVRIGFDATGRELKMLGSLLVGEGRFVFHTIASPTKKVLKASVKRRN